MGSAHYKLSLRIRHPQLDLSIVCGKLGLTPTHIWKAGDKRRTPKGTPLPGDHDLSYCLVILDDDLGKSLAHKIASAIATLQPHSQILDEVTSSGGRVSLFIGWFSSDVSSEMIGRTILSGLADLKIDLEIDVYCGETAKNNSQGI